MEIKGDDESVPFVIEQGCCYCSVTAVESRCCNSGSTCIV